VKTLQHTPRLSHKEKKLFDELLSLTAGEYVKHCNYGYALNGSQWSEVEKLLLPNNLTLVQLRIALRSMRRGTPTFLDQEIAIKFIDHLFKLSRLSRVEKEEING